MDFSVDIENTYDDGCEDKIDKNDYQVDTGNRESESTSQTRKLKPLNISVIVYV